MGRWSRFASVALALVVTAPTAAQESLFERDVLPILTKNCLGCHGGLRQKGGLDMRTIQSLLKGGKSGPAAASGDAASRLLKRIAADEMPPTERKLTATEKNHLRQWIVAGMPTVAQRQKNDAPHLPAGKKHLPAEVSAAIDRHLADGWKLGKIAPAARSDDAEFLRRVTLDLSGRVPLPEEAAAFLDSTEADKRAKRVDALLASPQFGEQFGRTWRDWVAPPELPSDANGGRQPHNETNAFGKWMGQRFSAGDPWDKIVRDILTVEGDIKNQPQVIFFGLAGDGGKLTPDGAGRAVASLFLGVQLQCAQCHDDPYRAWSQRDHWALAAFFGKLSGGFTKVNETPVSGKSADVVIPKTSFKNVGSAVPAAFLGSKAFSPKAGQPLRPQLVDWLVSRENPYFAKAFANRLWFYLFARGLVTPVDDFRDLNPPTHPGLLNLLANEFIASDYDVKHLIRCICGSEAYQRTSRVPAGADEQVVAAQTGAFARMPLRVMTADVLFDSLKQAYGDPKLDLRSLTAKDANTMGESAAIGDAYLEFLRRFGTNEEDATDFTHGIPQMLTMINHPRLLAGSKALDGFRKANPGASAEKTVEWLYLGTLSRRPTNDEMAEARRYLARSENYSGVLWMLINRSEYLLVR